MSQSSPLRRPPQRHHLLMILPLLDHHFILYLLIILVDIITCFDVLYSGIGCITWSYLTLYFLKVIYTHHFLLYLSFFYFLYTYYCCFWIMLFLLDDSDFMSLRKHHFLPVFSIALATLRAMFSLVGGSKRVEEGSFAINAKLFDNLVAFCLNFKKI